MIYQKKKREREKLNSNVSMTPDQLTHMSAPSHHVNSRVKNNYSVFYSISFDFVKFSFFLTDYEPLQISIRVDYLYRNI